MAKFRIDVDGKKIADEIQERIEDGVENAASEIDDEMRDIAKSKIRDEGAVFRHELLNGFQSARVEFGNSSVVSLRNLSNHAPAQEHGVSGTEVKRDTPYSYTDTKPPLDDLIPWVRQNLAGTGFWPDDLPGNGPPSGNGGPSGNSPPSSSSGPSSNGGPSSTTASSGVSSSGGSGKDFTDSTHNPLMGAEDLDEGTDVIYSTDTRTGTGTITKVAASFESDYDWDYEVDMNDEDGYLQVTFSEISNYDGRGITDTNRLEIGQTVYSQPDDNFVKVHSFQRDSDGNITGVEVRYNPDDTIGNLLDPDQIELYANTYFEDLAGEAGTLRDGFINAWNEVKDTDAVNKFPDALAYIDGIANKRETKFKPELIQTLVDASSEVNVEAGPSLGAPAPLEEMKQFRDDIEQGTELVFKDQNGKYMARAGFFQQNINDEWSNTNMFPNQRIVVFHKDEREFLRGTVKEFPGQDDSSLKFELDKAPGSRFNINDKQIGPYKLAGYEDFDSLRKFEQKNRLERYFDEHLDGAYKNWLESKHKNKIGLAEPKTGSVSEARNFWTGEIFDRYKDLSLVKEQVRQFRAIVSYKDSKIKNRPSLGGSILSLNGTDDFVGIFLSDNQYKNISDWDKAADSNLILAHEAKHALTSTLGYERSHEPHDGGKMLKKSNWKKNGTQTATGKELPTTAQSLFFRDNPNQGDVIGGTGWIPDAYKAARKGESGIQNYSPSFDTGTDEPYKRLHEAANYAWWLQMIAGRKKYRDNGSISNNDEIFVRGVYSVMNPAETLATLEEIMWGENANNVNWEDRLEYLDKYYPWLIEAWLEGHNPPSDVENKLESLGYTVS